LFIAQKGDGWKDKVVLLYLFKQENGSFERTERKNEGNGFWQLVSGSFYFIEEFHSFIVHLTFHGYDHSSFFQKRETQDEKGPKIGKSP
jgi:hypothetical protein